MTKRKKVDTKIITAFVYKGSSPDCDCWEIAFKQGNTKFRLKRHIETRWYATLYAKWWVHVYRRRLVKRQPFTVG